MAGTDMTELLRRFAQGDKEAEAELLPQVYRELHRIARGCLRGERPDHSLQATALVNEVYLRLSAQQEFNWKDRAHFFAVAARMMRRILVDYARRRRAGKRDGAVISLDEGLVISAEQCGLVADLDTALQRLESLHSRQAKVVELRFFSGLNEDEIAEALGVSVRTVKRDWRMARAWLYGELAR
jgi:RNA polymerase sigma-70 factor (ECF subfamily)